MNRHSFLLAAVGRAVCAVACSQKESGTRGPRPDEVPPTITVEGSSMIAGLAGGKLREDRTLATFRITTSVVRTSEYRHCVEAGACEIPNASTVDCSNAFAELPRGATYAITDAPNLPLTCATPKQADAYCRWIGGALQNEAQWLLAARGPAVHRFAWGDTPGTCDQHPLGSGEASCCNEGCEPKEHFALAMHPSTASPKGALDVLVTPSELVASSTDAVSSACAGSASACLVTGRTPGSIDAFLWIPMARLGGALATVPTFAFRCVWNEVSP